MNQSGNGLSKGFDRLSRHLWFCRGGRRWTRGGQGAGDEAAAGLEREVLARLAEVGLAGQ
jgi:hypothetical protein